MLFPAPALARPAAVAVRWRSRCVGTEVATGAAGGGGAAARRRRGVSGARRGRGDNAGGGGGARRWFRDWRPWRGRRRTSGAAGAGIASTRSADRRPGNRLLGRQPLAARPRLASLRTAGWFRRVPAAVQAGGRRCCDLAVLPSRPAVRPRAPSFVAGGNDVSVGGEFRPRENFATR